VASLDLTQKTRTNPSSLRQAPKRANARPRASNEATKSDGFVGSRSRVSFISRLTCPGGDLLPAVSLGRGDFDMP